MHPANQKLWKPDKLSQGAHNQASYPSVQWENTLDKRGATESQEEEEQQQQTEIEGNVRSRNNQEHRTTHAA